MPDSQQSPDPSWRLDSYNPELQAAYAKLSTTLGLCPLHAGPYESDTEYHVHTNLHSFLNLHPTLFLDFVADECDRPRLSATGLRFLHPLVSFASRLDKALIQARFTQEDQGEEAVEELELRTGCDGSSSTQSAGCISTTKRSSDASDTCIKKAPRLSRTDSTPISSRTASSDSTLLDVAEDAHIWRPREALPEDDITLHVTGPNAYQKLMNKLDIKFHIQWELERLLGADACGIGWEDVQWDDLSALQGDAVDVGSRLDVWIQRIGDRSGKTTTRVSSRAKLLREVDLEEASIRAGDLRGVGNTDPNWHYGGKLVYTVNVALDCDRLFALSPADLPGKSFRLARRFGSRRILVFKLKGTGAQRRRAMDLFVGRRLVLFGRCYRAFWAPPDRDAIIALEVSDSAVSVYDPAVPSFEQYLAMFNHLPSRSEQALAKWAARPQLLLSDSVPSVLVDLSAVIVIPDIVSAGGVHVEQILTDGCGLMSEALARRIANSLRLPSGRPTVLQVRFAGTKGLLVVMNQEQERLYAGRDIVLRDSMVKASSAKEYVDDPCLRTVDVVGVGTEMLKLGVSLSAEPIIAMVHNGVPNRVFLDMAARSLERLRDSYLPRPLEGETEDCVLKRIIAGLWRDGVGAERKRKELAEAGLSSKLAGRRPKGNTSDVEPAIDNTEPVLGQPGSLAESLVQALQSGFHPLHSAFTCAKLHHFMKTQVDRAAREFKITVDASLSAYIIPDGLGILEPDEIFVSFSGLGPIDSETRCPMTFLSGPCIALRSPCKLPTDHELTHLKDCIVMSASSACDRSPASFLAGGDYDGDTVQLFWDPQLIKHFVNADARYAVVPEDFQTDNFEKELVKGTDFLRSLDGAGSEKRILNYQTFLLEAVIMDNSTSLYSDMHGNAVYSLGLDHPETVRLAHMFCHVLDARKSGLKIKPEVKRRDMNKYGGVLAWRMWKKGEDDDQNRRRVTRKLGSFIMDELMEISRQKGDEVMAHFPSELPHRSHADHAALSRIYLAASKSPPTVSELTRLEAHVRACQELWKRIRERRIDNGIRLVDLYDRLVMGEPVPLASRAKRAADNPSPTRSSSHQSAREDTQAQVSRTAQMRELAQIWHDKLGVDDIPSLCFFGDTTSLRRMKISCAVEMTKRSGTAYKQLFPFDVDFRMICAMKAEYIESTSSDTAVTVLKSNLSAMKPYYHIRATGTE